MNPNPNPSPKPKDDERKYVPQYDNTVLYPEYISELSTLSKQALPLSNADRDRLLLCMARVLLRLSA